MVVNFKKNLILMMMLPIVGVNIANASSSRVGEEVGVVQQSTKRITGTVSDENGALIGATVMVKGTADGTVTDLNGGFSLELQSGATIVISYVGYISQEIKIGNEKVINVVLEPEGENLDEVFVIGYGTAKKSDLTGSTARVDLKALEKSANVNLLQSMKGLVPGLNVGVATSAGADPAFSIRGKNTISGSTAPLIVLDGIIYRGSLVDINSADIESIDVLKDASSTAIYGSQAANGVILITTKSGGDGEKPVIEYNGSIALTTPIKKIEYMNRDGFLQHMADLYVSKSRMGENLEQANPDWDPSAYLKSAESVQGYLDGTDTNWYDLLTEKSPYTMNHNVSLRGNSKYNNYFVSFGYTDQKQKAKNDKYKRYNIRMNLTSKITDWLKVGTDAFFTVSDYSGYSPSFSSITRMMPLLKAYDEDGNIVKYPDGSNLSPLLSVNNPDKDMRYNLSGVVFADISIPWVKGLSYRANYSHDAVWYKKYTFDPIANQEYGKGYKKNSLLHEFTFDNILTYKRDFGLHSVNATMVYGVEKRKYEDTSATGNHFSDQTFTYNNLGLAQSDLSAVTSSAWLETSLYSMFRIVYSYNNRYIFTGTMRRDGFSGFGENQKFGNFPSLAAAWRISEENFMQQYEWLDNLKLRLSWGKNGNRTVGRYSTQSLVTKSDGYVFGEGGTPEMVSRITRLPNPDLKWETTASWNFGLDFTLLGGRLYGTYDFYVSNTNDLLYNISIPAINGMTNSYIPTNIGKLSNIGHEFSITGIPVQTKDFTWKATLNFSTNKNKVKTILGYDVDGDGKEDDLVSSGIFIGKPLSALYNYVVDGMWQYQDYLDGTIPAGFTYGTYKIKDLNGDGKISADNDRKIVGYSDPLYRFSIQNVLSYKNFDLNIFVNSIQGGSDYYKAMSVTEGIPDHLHGWNKSSYDYWTPENPDAKYRQIGAYNTTVGNAFSPYTSRSFIRLQELSLAYNLPKSLLAKVNIRRAKVYVSGTNLLTITGWDGIDPEAGQGVEVTSGYPTMKSFVFGLNFEF